MIDICRLVTAEGCGAGELFEDRSDILVTAEGCGAEELFEDRSDIPPQVALRWVVQTGAAFTTQSHQREHIAEDLQV